MAFVTGSVPWLKDYLVHTLNANADNSSPTGHYLQVLTNVSPRRQLTVYDGKHAIDAVLSPAAADSIDADPEGTGVTTTNLLGHLLALQHVTVLPHPATVPPRATLLLRAVEIFQSHMTQRPAIAPPSVTADPDVAVALQNAVNKTLAQYRTASTMKRALRDLRLAPPNPLLSSDPHVRAASFNRIVDRSSFPDPHHPQLQVAPVTAAPPLHPTFVDAIPNQWAVDAHDSDSNDSSAHLKDGAVVHHAAVPNDVHFGQTMPDVPDIPTLSDVPDGPVMSDVHDAPDSPYVPDLSAIADNIRERDEPNQPNQPHQRNESDQSHKSGELDQLEVTDECNVPNALHAPDVSKALHAPDASHVPGVLDRPSGQNAPSHNSDSDTSRGNNHIEDESFPQTQHFEVDADDANANVNDKDIMDDDDDDVDYEDGNDDFDDAITTNSKADTNIPCNANSATNEPVTSTTGDAVTNEVIANANNSDEEHSISHDSGSPLTTNVLKETVAPSAEETSAQLVTTSHSQPDAEMVESPHSVREVVVSNGAPLDQDDQIVSEEGSGKKDTARAKIKTKVSKIGNIRQPDFSSLHKLKNLMIITADPLLSTSSNLSSSLLLAPRATIQHSAKQHTRSHTRNLLSTMAPKTVVEDVANEGDGKVGDEAMPQRTGTRSGSTRSGSTRSGRNRSGGNDVGLRTRRRLAADQEVEKSPSEDGGMGASVVPTRTSKRYKGAVPEKAATKEVITVKRSPRTRSKPPVFYAESEVRTVDIDEMVVSKTAEAADNGSNDGADVEAGEKDGDEAYQEGGKDGDEEDGDEEDGDEEDGDEEDGDEEDGDDDDVIDRDALVSADDAEKEDELDIVKTDASNDEGDTTEKKESRAQRAKLLAFDEANGGDDGTGRKQLVINSNEPAVKAALKKIIEEMNFMRGIRQAVDENPTAFIMNSDIFLPSDPNEEPTYMTLSTDKDVITGKTSCEAKAGMLSVPESAPI